ncbi:hypothetical protein KRR26_14000 [Corallococcus sp. M34]|uniref:hypothetical protein n=1 Tax=Citreicoccus inhibens TaxID=2849499 RepID=UPI001C22B27C|nr:hypothetical protein [Citreicoccus inhibens]MBU8896727.1 hypothetical protein [Citreicoccus inhibens]
MALDVHRFREELVYRASAPAAEVLEDIAAIEAFDRSVEARRSTQGRLAWACGLLSMVVMAVFFILQGASSAAFVLLLVSGLGLLGIAVYFFSERSASRRFDLSDRRYLLIRTMLDRLRPDLSPDEPVSLTLDLSPVDDASKLRGKGPRGRWQTEEFLDPWLDLEARLADGTYWRLGMTDRLRKSRRTSRSASGRTKVKTRETGVTVAEVQLRVKPERHPALAGLEREARASVRLPPGVELARLQVSEDRLLMRARTGYGEWAGDVPQIATMMMLSLYQVLNYSTSLRKRGDARSA